MLKRVLVPLGKKKDYTLLSCLHQLPSRGRSCRLKAQSLCTATGIPGRGQGIPEQLRFPPVTQQEIRLKSNQFFPTIIWPQTKKRGERRTSVVRENKRCFIFLRFQAISRKFSLGFYHKN